MTRRQQIERIVIGTLIADYKHSHEHADGVIEAGMFDNVTYRDIYAEITRQAEAGESPNIMTLAKALPQHIDAMVDAATEGHFGTKLADINRLRMLSGDNLRTIATFDQYVRQLVIYYYHGNH